MYNQEEISKKALILIEKKKYKEAKSILIEEIKDIKNLKIDHRIYFLLYVACEGLNENQSAKKYLEKCLKINNKNHIVLNNLANIYLKEGNIYQAEKFYLKSIEYKKDYLVGIINIAIFYQNIGRHEEAKKFYLKAINLSPKQISLYFNLSRIDQNFIDEDKLKNLQQVMEDKKIDPKEMSSGFFLLAENERKKNNYREEMKKLEKAHHYLFNSQINVNNLSLDYWKKIIPKKFDKINFTNSVKKSELTKFKPMFIIGLPRSGSTMVEAILSSGENKVKNLGETNIINGSVITTHSKILKEENPIMNLDILYNKILYLLVDRKIFDIKNKIFTEKSLENFFYIEIILKIFPNAKFINTFRNLEDNVFAIYQQSLSKLSWTHSIENILEYINEYIKIIRYFKKKYPDQIFSIDLEKLTNNSEEVSKKLFQFCDLKWKKEVLDFNKRKDLLIKTASNIQIRNKISSYDNTKYKPYKEFLKSFSEKYEWIN